MKQGKDSFGGKWPLERMFDAKAITRGIIYSNEDNLTRHEVVISENRLIHEMLEDD